MFSTSEGYHEYIGGYHEYIGDVQYCGGYHEYIRGCSVHQGDTMSTSGDTMSTSGDTMSTSEGYHEYIGRGMFSTVGIP